MPEAAAQRALFDRYRSHFHPVDPYADFPVAEHPRDPQGWGSDHPFFKGVIDLVKPQLVIEVGSWKGMSAIHMADILRDSGRPGVVMCVDTWLGSTEHVMTPELNGNNPSLRVKNGFPQIFYTFMANVIGAGHQERIVPVPNTSEACAIMFKALKIKAGVIYIDGAHEQKLARRDLEAFWPVLADDGVMIVDDYIYWWGVTQAADGFIRKHKPAGVVREPGKLLLSRRPLPFEPITKV
jgi:predicted O-methyltransferase YrrM